MGAREIGFTGGNIDWAQELMSEWVDWWAEGRKLFGTRLPSKPFPSSLVSLGPSTATRPSLKASWATAVMYMDKDVVCPRRCVYGVLGSRQVDQHRIAREAWSMEHGDWRLETSYIRAVVTHTAVGGSGQSLTNTPTLPLRAMSTNKLTA